MKILICGSSGFIGVHLVRDLAQAGHEIVCLDLVPPTDYAHIAQFHQGDVVKPEDVRPLLDGIDCVINLAAKHHDFGVSRQEYFETNETGTRRLLECMAEAGVDKYILYSSVAVYGNGATNCDENSQPTPVSAYGASKLAAEAVTHDWVGKNDCRSVVIIRPTVVFGEGNTANVLSLIRQVDLGLFCYFGSRQAVKSLCYVKNLTAATDFCLQRMKPGLALFNYVDKEDLAVQETVNIISNALNKRPPSLTLPLWLGVAICGVFDLLAKVSGKNLRVSAARVRKLASSTRFRAQAIRDYGFQPQYSLEQGLGNMVRWYCQEVSKKKRIEPRIPPK